MFKKLLFSLLFLSALLNAKTIDPMLPENGGCDYFQQGTTTCIPGDPVADPPGIWLPNCGDGDRLMQGQGETSCTATTPVDPPGLFLPSCQWYGQHREQGTEICVEMHLPTLKKTGQTVVYAEFDDAYYLKGVTHSYSRDDDKEVVTDHVSRLMWQDDAAVSTVKKIWTNAGAYCSNDVTTGGYDDWRLPTRAELIDIADTGRYNLAINPIFQNIISDYYWTSTGLAGVSSMAWVAHFSTGVQGWRPISENRSVMCVRDGE